MQQLLDQGIATRRGVMCAHRQPPYAEGRAVLPISEAAEDHAILLPLYPQMTDADQDAVVAALAAALAQAEAA